MHDDLATLVTRLYRALATGDRDELGAILAPGFVGEFADGMPVGGGRHDGARAAMREGWGAIGRAYAAAAHPGEFVPCADGRLLVLGTYRGTRRADGTEFAAGFMHLWTGADGQLVHLRQLTDTVAWPPPRDG